MEKIKVTLKEIELLERSNLKNRAIVDDILDSIVEIDDCSFTDILPKEE